MPDTPQGPVIEQGQLAVARANRDGVDVMDQLTAAENELVDAGKGDLASVLYRARTEISYLRACQSELARERRKADRERDAMREALRESICTDCHGESFVETVTDPQGNEYQECDTCAGTGRREQDIDELQRLINGE